MVSALHLLASPNSHHRPQPQTRIPSPVTHVACGSNHSVAVARGEVECHALHDPCWSLSRTHAHARQLFVWGHTEYAQHGIFESTHTAGGETRR